MSRFLVTGGCGFAGSHLVSRLLQHGHQVTVLDCLTYAGSLCGLSHLAGPQLKILYHDFRQPLPEFTGATKVDYVIHNGAESHVLRSLQDPGKFVESNVLGTLNILEWARQVGCKKFVYVSTDEVFGPAGDEPYHEGAQLKPTNPYSATKAGGEFLTHSYFRSFGVPALITRTINMFGERQHAEKFVPLAIKRIIAGEEVPIHINQFEEIGSRQWLYAGEQAKALAWLAENGEPGKAYHVSEGCWQSNLEMARLIADVLGQSLKYRFVQYAWPGHDLHYSISTKGTPERENWRMSESFIQLLEQTVLWYRDHSEWLT